MLLNNQQITEKIKNEIKICIERNENEYTTQTLSDSVKAELRWRFIAIQAYFKNQEKHTACRKGGGVVRRKSRELARKPEGDNGQEKRESLRKT